MNSNTKILIVLIIVIIFPIIINEIYTTEKRILINDANKILKLINNEKNEFKEYIRFLIDRYTETELFNIWKAIIDTAKKGSPQALKLFFELKNLYGQNGKQDGGVVIISGEEKLEQ